MKPLLALLAMVGVARGENLHVEPSPPPIVDETPTAPVPTTQPVSAADVSGAPVPGSEHGRTDEIDTGDGAGRKVGRALLFIPKSAIQLAAQPARGWFYLQDRYGILRVFKSQFQTDDQKVAIYPTAFFETGFGLNVGVRSRFKDLFGGGERISFRAAIGGQYKRIVALDVQTSGRIATGVKLRYSITQDHFYGYGNGETTIPGMPIDPLTSDDSVASNFRTEMVRLSPFIKVNVTEDLAVTATGAFIDKAFAPSESSGNGLSLDEAYDVAMVPGFTPGTRFVYDEIEVAYDTRRSATKWDYPGIRSTGTLLLGFVGRHDGLRDDNPGFYRIGIDLQRYIRLTDGPRVLELRALGEMVTGERDEVPFSELPRLGGAALLRGYTGDRFRDRVAIVAQASYLWSAADWLAPSLFVDVGRVYSGLDDLSVKHLRVGYGAALELYERQGMLVRFQVATSREGGAFAYLTFNPVYDARSRMERH